MVPLQCADCGYSKAGIEDKPCPECGCGRVMMRRALPISVWSLLIPFGVFVSPAIWFAGAIYWLKFGGSTDGQAAFVVFGPMLSVPFALLAVMVWVACMPDSTPPRCGVSRWLHFCANVFGVLWIGFFATLAVATAIMPA